MCSRKTLDACWDQALNLEARNCGMGELESQSMWPLWVAVVHASQHTTRCYVQMDENGIKSAKLVHGSEGAYFYKCRTSKTNWDDMHVPDDH